MKYVRLFLENYMIGLGKLVLSFDDNYYCIVITYDFKLIAIL